MYLRYKRGRYVATAQRIVVVERSRRQTYKFHPPESVPTWRVEVEATVYCEDSDFGDATPYTMKSDGENFMPSMDDVLNMLSDAIEKHKRAKRKKTKEQV